MLEAFTRIGNQGRIKLRVHWRLWSLMGEILLWARIWFWDKINVQSIHTVCFALFYCGVIIGLSKSVCMIFRNGFISPYFAYTGMFCLYLFFYIESAAMFQSSSWWLYQMETFPALLALCGGIDLSPVNSPHKGQWREFWCYLWSAPE